MAFRKRDLLEVNIHNIWYHDDINYSVLTDKSKIPFVLIPRAGTLVETIRGFIISNHFNLNRSQLYECYQLALDMPRCLRYI